MKDHWEKKGIDLLEMAKFHREKAEKFEREADELLRKARKNGRTRRRYWCRGNQATEL